MAAQRILYFRDGDLREAQVRGREYFTMDVRALRTEAMGWWMDLVDVRSEFDGRGRQEVRMQDSRPIRCRASIVGESLDNGWNSLRQGGRICHG